MEQVHLKACPSCGYETKPFDFSALPVEPLYDLQVAATLIPMRTETLRKWLSRNAKYFAPRYRLQGRMHRKIRLLSAVEIKFIRSKALRGDCLIDPVVADRYISAVSELPEGAEPFSVLTGIAERPKPWRERAAQRDRLAGREPATVHEQEGASPCHKPCS